jgi:hypothetical protein
MTTSPTLDTRSLAAVDDLDDRGAARAPARPLAVTDQLPVLRLLPAPVSEPPYDDELPHPPSLRLLPPLVLHGGSAPAGLLPDHALPSVFPGGSIPPLLAPVAPRPTGGDPTPAIDSDDDDVAIAADAQARRTSAAVLPSPQRFCLALLQRLEEVLAGVRPVAQLQRDLTLDAFDRLASAVAHAGPRDGSRPALRAVRSLHVQTRPEGVAEVCASVQRGARRVAVALRIEGRDGAWQVTDLVGV